jgi:hypothetical protein
MIPQKLTVFHRNALKLVLRDDNVIKKADAEDLSRFDDLTGDRDVRLAGLRNARGMVVGKDDRRSGIFERRTEDLARMDYIGRQTSCTDNSIQHGRLNLF